MAVTITPSLIGVYSPRTVQIVITGMTVGEAYTVTGSWSGGTWPVRAGTGTAEGTQIVLSDIAAPINVPITYTVTHAGTDTTSAEIVVDYPRRYVLQTLTGDTSVAFDMIRNGAPQALAVRQAAFPIPGRTSPVVVYDVAGGESGQLVADTKDSVTRTLKAMLRTGAPLLLRTDGSILDLEAVSFLSFSRVSSSLIGMTRRRWELDYLVLDDPEPDTLTGLPTYADYNAAYAGLTFADYNAEWAGLTYADYNVHDWATRAAT